MYSRPTIDINQAVPTQISLIKFVALTRLCSLVFLMFHKFPNEAITIVRAMMSF